MDAVAPAADKKPAAIVFIGPPGSGKGTQAGFLRRDLGNVCHLATGDMLRDIMKTDSPLASRIRPIVESGQLVGDDIIMDLIRDKIVKPDCKDGFILDGFPRTLNQAHLLDSLLASEHRSVDQAFEFRVNEPALIERVTGRLVHLASGRTYHEKFQPPKVAGLDDVTGEPLIRRADDNKETLIKRLGVYKQQTTPVLAHYQQQGVLTVLNAESKPTEVYEQLRSKLRK